MTLNLPALEQCAKAATQEAPLPWSAEVCRDDGDGRWGDPPTWANLRTTSGRVFAVDAGEFFALSPVVAEFIVSACNAHEQLLAESRELQAIKALLVEYVDAAIEASGRIPAPNQTRMGRAFSALVVARAAMKEPSNV